MKKILLSLLFVSTSAFASGELLISSQSETPGVVPKEGINIPLLHINLAAKNEDVLIEKLVFQRTGLSDAQDIKSIRAIGKNVYSRKFPVLTNDQATITFFGKFVIPAETTKDITITANLDIQGIGRTIGLKLIEVVSSADTNNIGTLPIGIPSGPTPEAEASSFKASNITIEKIPFTVSRLRLGRWQKLGRLRLRNQENKKIELDTLYIKNEGVGALSDILQNTILTSRNKIVSGQGTFTDKKSTQFSFLSETTIDAKSSLLLEIWGKIKRNKSTYSINFTTEDTDITIK